mgnify:CR=1 FL=1
MRPAIFQEAIRDISRQVCAHFKDDLKGIVLYGSYARGDFDIDSDLNVAVLLDCSKEELGSKVKRRSEIVSDIGLKYNIFIDLNFIPNDEYERWLPVLPLYQNIEREGFRLG